MACVNAAQFVSGTRADHGGSGSERRARLSQFDLTKGRTGLRPLNQVDMIQVNAGGKALAKRVRSKAFDAQIYRQALPVVCGKGMKLVFVGAEVAPWSKTGGLGDVLGGLPPALAANGHRVMTITPRYDQYSDAWDTSVQVEVKFGDRTEKARFFHCYKRGVDRVFVDHPCFLEKVWGKTGSKIYGPNAGTDYVDNQLRFSLLCQAALKAPLILSLNSSRHHSGVYGEDVVFIANDWHTALLPCYLRTFYQSLGMYKNAKVAFCIHNIAYQGRYASTDYSLLNLPSEFKSSFDFIDGHNKPVKGKKINWMKAGILEADRVVTVSPYYAQEVVSGEETGVELNNIIRKTGITGIVNGMDVQEWNPATDKYIDVNYDAGTVNEAKALLKEALQAELGLPVDRKIPLIGFIGRLEEQKGSDILVEAIPKFITNDVQLVVLGKIGLFNFLHFLFVGKLAYRIPSGLSPASLEFGVSSATTSLSLGTGGTGKRRMEKQIQGLEIKYPDKARGVAKFSIQLAHMITASSDFILIPSRFEPCGLIQLHGMRYGTVPIVSSTGGLVDTVKEGYTGFHIGTFNVDCEIVDPADVNVLAATVKRALAYYGTPQFMEMIQNCMAQDLSWKGPAKLWEKMLLSMEVIGEAGIEGEEVAAMAKENVPAP